MLVGREDGFKFPNLFADLIKINEDIWMKMLTAKIASFGFSRVSIAENEAVNNI